MVAEATGKTPEQVHQDIRRDFHLTAEKALDYGVVDKVLYKRRGARRGDCMTRDLRRDGRESGRARGFFTSERSRGTVVTPRLYARFVRLREVAQFDLAWI